MSPITWTKKTRHRLISREYSARSIPLKIMKRILITAGLIFLLPLICHADLVAYFPLDKDALDASGNGHHGTVIGTGVRFGQTGANGTTGQSADFAGTGHIDIPYHAALNSPDFTVSLWALADVAGGGLFRSLITNRDDVNIGEETHGWIIYNDFNAQWDFWTGPFDQPGLPWHRLSGGAVSNNVWTHLAISYNSVTSNKTIYVNGVLASAEAEYSPNGTEKEDIHIGGGGDTGLEFRFDGRIDEVALFDTTLSAGEIADIMNNGVQTEILATDFTGRTVAGKIASNISWTTTGLQDPGALTANDAPLFDTTDTQGHFAPDRNVDNEAPWSVDIPLTLEAGQITMDSVTLDFQHFNNSGVFQIAGRIVNWTARLIGAVSGEIGSETVAGILGTSGVETISFPPGTTLHPREAWTLTITAQGITGGNNTGLDAITVKGSTRTTYSTYATWAAANIPAGQDATFEGDANADGFANGLTYVFGNERPRHLQTPSTPQSPAIALPVYVPGDVQLVLNRSTDIRDPNSWTPILQYVGNTLDFQHSDLNLNQGSGSLVDGTQEPVAYYHYTAELIP